jgi:hypothetical protein
MKMRASTARSSSAIVGVRGVEVDADPDDPDDGEADAYETGRHGEDVDADVGLDAGPEHARAVIVCGVVVVHERTFRRLCARVGS